MAVPVTTNPSGESAGVGSIPPINGAGGYGPGMVIAMVDKFGPTMALLQSEQEQASVKTIQASYEASERAAGGAIEGAITEGVVSAGSAVGGGVGFAKSASAFKDGVSAFSDYQNDMQDFEKQIGDEETSLKADDGVAFGPSEDEAVGEHIPGPGRPPEEPRPLEETRAPKRSREEVDEIKSNIKRLKRERANRQEEYEQTKGAISHRSSQGNLIAQAIASPASQMAGSPLTAEGKQKEVISQAQAGVFQNLTQNANTNQNAAAQSYEAALNSAGQVWSALPGSR